METEVGSTAAAGGGFDIPEFASCRATVGRTARVGARPGRRTARDSSSASSGASSSSEDEEATARLGLAGLGFSGRSDAMETDAGAAPAAQATDGDAGGAEPEPRARATAPRFKQFEFDGDGWEDVGERDSDEEALLGAVGAGEDDYYDPDMDDLDQQFIDNRRLRHLPSHVRKSNWTPKAPRRHKVADPHAAAKDGAQSAASPETGSQLPRMRGAPPAPTPGEHSPMPCAEAALTGGAHGTSKAGDTQRQSGDHGPARATSVAEGSPTATVSPNDTRTEQPGAAGGRDAAGRWQAYVAPSGHAYYHNATTGETTWVKPEGFEGDGAAMQGPRTTTDAILSCPCCFNLLCIDCQRHDRFLHQYRAMFVQNCQVQRTERLRDPAAAPGDSSSFLYPVRCKSCQAEVGVMDEDEVFHFFDVLPSNG